MACDPDLRFEIRNAICGAEGEHVAALAEAGDQNEIALLCPLQRAGKHQQRMRRTGLAAGRVHIVLHSLIAQAGLLGERADDARQRAWHAEGGDIGGVDAGLLH